MHARIIVCDFGRNTRSWTYAPNVKRLDGKQMIRIRIVVVAIWTMVRITTVIVSLTKSFGTSLSHLGYADCTCQRGHPQKCVVMMTKE
jgi:hypothetical protein